MGVGARVRLLAGQAFALGLALAWTTIAANTLFLEAFGAERLPLTYLAAAATGAAASVLIGRAVTRRPLAQVAVRVLAGATVVLAASWVLLEPAGVDALSFVLVTLLPIALPIGFMFVVGQAGLLLDVRDMKARYPRVIGAFALGFAVGGLGGAPMLAVLGGTERLLIAAAAAAAALVALVVATLRRFPDELDAVEAVDDDAEATDLRALVRDRFIVLLTAFQMLSTIESQWLDFLVYDRAAARYPDPEDLATFVGRFTAIAYGADIAFLLLLAGLLLRRYGLRLGLVANPTVVLLIVLAVLGATAAQGGGATIVFVLTVAARATDLTLSDGTARTSVSAAYQAIPPNRRLDAQALVESMAVPIAIGVSGGALLVVQATVGTEGSALFVMAALVLATWAACATLVYGDYRRNLLDNLRHRRLVPGDLTGEPLALGTIDRLLDGPTERDVRLGVAALEAAATDASARLVRRAEQRRTPGHRVVLRALATVDPTAALGVARHDLGHADAEVRAAALEVLADHGDATDADRALVLLDDPDLAVRAALGDLLARHGGLEAGSAVVAALARQATDPDPEVRARASATAAAAAAGVDDVHPIAAALLEDPHPAVRAAGLEVIDLSVAPSLEAAVVPDLARRATADAAVAALARSGATGVAIASSVLVSWADVPRRATSTAVRALRTSPHPQAAAALIQHVAHPDRDLGLLVRRALAARRTERGPEGSAEDEAALATAISEAVADDVADAERIAQALHALAGTVDDDDAVIRALHDELALQRRRILAALAVRHGGEALAQVEFQLDQDAPRLHALAMEWLDATLATQDRTAVAVLDPATPLDDLARRGARDRTEETAAAVVADLVLDPGERWRRPWLQACALAAAPRVGLDEADLVRRAPVVDDDHRALLEEAAVLGRRDAT